MDPHHILTLTAIAIGSWIVGALVFLVVAISLPPDFGHANPNRSRRSILLGNLVGWPLIVVGVIVFPTPLNGTVLVLVGVALADFPSKQRILQSLLRREGVRSPLNRLRRFFKRPDILPVVSSGGSQG